MTCAEVAHGRGVEAVGKEIMNHLAPTSQLAVANGFTAVQQIGVPDEHIATAGQEAFRLEALLSHRLSPVGFEQGLRLRFGRDLLRSQPQYLCTEIGQAMAAWKVMEWTALRFDILQGKPNAAHVAVGVTMKMDRITVKMLLTANGEIQGLEGKGFASVQLAQQI